MKRALVVLAAAAMVMVAGSAGASILVAGWNFNDDGDVPDSLFAVSHGSGTMTASWTDDIQSFTGSTINLVDGDERGTDIAFRNDTVTDGVPANEGG